MQRATLVGYYGQKNTGDDAFLAVTAWGTSQYLGSDEILATAIAGVLPNTYGTHVRALYAPPVPQALFRAIPALYRPLWTYNRLREHLFSPRPSNIIFGGGSNFHTRAYIEDRSVLVRRAGPGPHFAVGVSIGPFRDKGADKACAKLLKQLAFVGVRDHASYWRAHQIAPTARVELTFDLVPLLPLVARVNMTEIRPARKGLGVAMCNYERFVGGDIEKENLRVRVVAQSIRNAAAAGLIDEVVLFDFNGHDRLGDASVSNTLAALLRGGVRLLHMRYSSDPASVLRAVAGLRGLIAMRMHAAAFAFCSRTPFVMLAYHEKCRQLANMIGLPPNLLYDAADLRVDALTQGIGRMLAHDAPLPSLPVEAAVERALRNWSWIEEEDEDHYCLREKKNWQSYVGS